LFTTFFLYLLFLFLYSFLQLDLLSIPISVFRTYRKDQLADLEYNSREHNNPFLSPYEGLLLWGPFRQILACFTSFLFLLS
jgi:hypothetical protein